jgi:hypothetical protein
MLLPLIFILLVVGTLEWILLGLWSRPYYRRGFVLYEEILRDCVAPLDSIDLKALSRAFRSVGWPSLAFALFTPHQIGFRERLVDVSLVPYWPVMRGLITADPERRTVTVSGRANMAPVAFLLAWLSLTILFFTDTGILWFALLWSCIPFVLIVASYRVQRQRYHKVLAWLRARLTDQYAPAG